MIVELTSTNKVVELTPRGGTGTIRARVWEGKTNTGVVVHAVIATIAHDTNEPADVVERFKAELSEHAAPTPAVAKAYDIRMFL